MRLVFFNRRHLRHAFRLWSNYLSRLLWQ